MVNRFVYLCIKNVYNMGKIVGISSVILNTDSWLLGRLVQKTVCICELIHRFISTFSQVLSTNKITYSPVLNLSYNRNPQDLLLSTRI